MDWASNGFVTGSCNICPLCFAMIHAAKMSNSKRTMSRSQIGLTFPLQLYVILMLKRQEYIIWGHQTHNFFSFFPSNSVDKHTAQLKPARSILLVFLTLKVGEK